MYQFNVINKVCVFLDVFGCFWWYVSIFASNKFLSEMTSVFRCDAAKVFGAVSLETAERLKGHSCKNGQKHGTHTND